MIKCKYCNLCKCWVSKLNKCLNGNFHRVTTKDSCSEYEKHNPSKLEIIDDNGELITATIS